MEDTSHAKQPKPTVNYRLHRFIRYLRADGVLYLMILPAVLIFLLFSYFPMYGIIMAFQSYRPALGYFGSPFVGLRHFRNFLADPYFNRVFMNTLTLGLLTLAIGFPAPILLALLFNEIKHMKFKKFTQTVSYMPYFLSTVIVVGITRDFLSMSDGVINNAVAFFGYPKINFFVQPEWFRPIYIGTGLWQGIGFGTIIYLAAIAGVNPELYEAAVIDGASRLKQVVLITLPSILPTMTILFIFAVSGIIGSDFQKILLIYSPATYSVSDVISTMVYRAGVIGPNQSYATAVGLFNSVLALLLLAASNYIAKRWGETSLW